MPNWSSIQSSIQIMTLCLVFRWSSIKVMTCITYTYSGLVRNMYWYLNTEQSSLTLFWLSSCPFCTISNPSTQPIVYIVKHSVPLYPTQTFTNGVVLFYDVRNRKHQIVLIYSIVQKGHKESQNQVNGDYLPNFISPV